MHRAVKADFKTNYTSSGVREFYREKNARFKKKVQCLQKKCKFYRKSANLKKKCTKLLNIQCLCCTNTLPY